MADQLSMADQFEQSPPLRLKQPRDGFTHCAACNGSGVQHGPKRCCDECRGMGHVLLPEITRSKRERAD